MLKLEDNGDVERAWTPDFPTRYLPMAQPRQNKLSAIGITADKV